MVMILVDSYSSITGTFTVPPGGDGFYYFSLYLLVFGGESANFGILVNGQLMCTAYSDLTASPDNDYEATSCNGITYAVQGNHGD